MKRLIRLTAMFLLLTILITGLAQSADVSSGAQMRGVWVSTAYQIDYPTQGTSEKQLKKQCTDILDEVQACGLNTVFLQVRPMADAFYPSDLFPWSVYLTGKVGKSPGFDPLTYWVEQAHQRGLKLHAWINPYRISKGAEAEQMFQNLPDSHPAKQHPDWVVKYDGGYYFDPGIPEVRELICAGVQEIVSGYDVDGIQFDDYFYPAPDFDDDDTYRKYGKDFSSVYHWRRDNVNQLVQSVKAITDTKSGCDFGISPSGIWRNRTSDVRGSDTQGYESYSQCYADAVTWIESGWLDYICPQIYWNIGFDAADYRTLAKWWAQTVKGSDTKLYIGMAAYKAGGVDAQTEWQGCGEIVRQLDCNAKIAEISGFALFSDRDLARVDGLTAAVTKYCGEQEKQMQVKEQVPASDSVIDTLIQTKDGVWERIAAAWSGLKGMIWRESADTGMKKADRFGGLLFV